MSQPILGAINKVSSGQRFLSLVELDARILKLEAAVQEIKVQLSGPDSGCAADSIRLDLDEQLKFVESLHKKLQEHQKFGHPTTSSKLTPKKESKNEV